jgi:methyl-accepting chemotaxis protein
MSKFTISRILTLFALVVTAGLATSIGVQTMALENLKIGSPTYKGIIHDKDLIADILPPPLFVIEPYMLAVEAAAHRERLADNLEKITALRKDYEARKAYWTTIALPDDKRALLADGVIATAETFWAALDGGMGALRNGDAGEQDAFLEELLDRFNEHRVTVGKLVSMTASQLSQAEAEAALAGQRYEMAALAGSALSVLLFIAGVVFIRRRAVSPVVRMTSVMEELARENYEVAVPFSDRADEIGRMAQTLSVFRDAGLAKRRLEDEAEEGLRLRADEAAEREAEKAREARQLFAVIERLGAGLQRLSECNIRMTIDEPFAAKFEPMRRDFNNSIGAFQDTLQQVLRATEQLQSSSAEMSSAADNMAKRTEKQAVEIESTSAALVQMSSSVDQSAGRSRETRGLVREARDCARSSSDVVRDAIRAMQDIERASDEIGQIISVIDEIAF